MSDLTEFLEARWAEDTEPCAGASEYEDCTHHSEQRKRDIEAKRRIIEDHKPWEYGVHKTPMCGRCGDPPGYEFARQEFPCPTIRLLAAVYADHNEYQEAWRV